ncbi:MAG: MBL fold metallo-hydrolase [Proteobacteria bacterium]|nr:MBL fold metallo-hydrolase [Pseudomonadota bacterium]
MTKEKNFGPLRFLPGPNRGRYPYCHSVYIKDAKVIIDPSSDRERLIEIQKTEGIESVWLTHWHEDHLMHLDLFRDSPVWIAEEDAPPLSDLELFLDWYDITDPAFRKTFRKQLLDEFHFQPIIPDRLLKDGDLLDAGGMTVEVIHIPGHTPGHLAFFFREPAVLYMGDVDLTRFGPWYGDRYSTLDETISSVEKLRSIPAKVWLTCHETGIFEENPGELWDDYLKVIQTREEKLQTVLQSGPSKEEIINNWIIYSREREPREFYEFGEWANMRKHLDRLIKQGLVAHRENRYHLV